MANSYGDSELATTTHTTRASGSVSSRASPPLHVESSTRRYPVERRHENSRQELLRRITVEYDEMPGLRLTLSQAIRLFGLREDICVRVLDTLVDAAVLRRDVDGVFALNDVEP